MKGHVGLSDLGEVAARKGGSLGVDRCVEFRYVIGSDVLCGQSGRQSFEDAPDRIDLDEVAHGDRRDERTTVRDLLGESLREQPENRLARRTAADIETSREVGHAQPSPRLKVPVENRVSDSGVRPIPDSVSFRLRVLQERGSFVSRFPRDNSRRPSPRFRFSRWLDPVRRGGVER